MGLIKVLVWRPEGPGRVNKLREAFNSTTAEQRNRRGGSCAIKDGRHQSAVAQRRVAEPMPGFLHICTTQVKSTCARLVLISAYLVVSNSSSAMARTLFLHPGDAALLPATERHQASFSFLLQTCFFL